MKLKRTLAVITRSREIRRGIAYIHTYTHTCKHTYIYIYIYTFSFHQKVSLLVRIEKVYIFNIHLEICNVFENSYVYIFVSKMVVNCDDVDCVNVAICSTLV